MRLTHIRKPSHFIGIDTVSGVQGEIEEFSFFPWRRRVCLGIIVARLKIPLMHSLPSETE